MGYARLHNGKRQVVPDGGMTAYQARISLASKSITDPLVSRAESLGWPGYRGRVSSSTGTAVRVRMEVTAPLTSQGEPCSQRSPGR